MERKNKMLEKYNDFDIYKNIDHNCYYACLNIYETPCYFNLETLKKSIDRYWLNYEKKIN